MWCYECGFELKYGFLTTHNNDYLCRWNSSNIQCSDLRRQILQSDKYDFMYVNLNQNKGFEHINYDCLCI